MQRIETKCTSCSLSFDEPNNDRYSSFIKEISFFFFHNDHEINQKHIYFFQHNDVSLIVLLKNRNKRTSLLSEQDNRPLMVLPTANAIFKWVRERQGQARRRKKTHEHEKRKRKQWLIWIVVREKRNFRWRNVLVLVCSWLFIWLKIMSSGKNIHR